MHMQFLMGKKNSFTRTPGVLSAFFAIAAMLCFGAFAIIGSSVDAQGILHEPFFLVPAGCAFAALCLFCLAGALISMAVSGKRAGSVRSDRS